MFVLAERAAAAVAAQAWSGGRARTRSRSPTTGAAVCLFGNVAKERKDGLRVDVLCFD